MQFPRRSQTIAFDLKIKSDLKKLRRLFLNLKLINKGCCIIIIVNCYCGKLQNDFSSTKMSFEQDRLDNKMWLIDDKLCMLAIAIQKVTQTKYELSYGRIGNVSDYKIGLDLRIRRMTRKTCLWNIWNKKGSFLRRKSMTKRPYHESLVDGSDQDNPHSENTKMKFKMNQQLCATFYSLTSTTASMISVSSLDSTVNVSFITEGRGDFFLDSRRRGGLTTA